MPMIPCGWANDGLGPSNADGWGTPNGDMVFGYVPIVGDGEVVYLIPSPAVGGPAVAEGGNIMPGPSPLSEPDRREVLPFPFPFPFPLPLPSPLDPGPVRDSGEVTTVVWWDLSPSDERELLVEAVEAGATAAGPATLDGSIVLASGRPEW